MDEMPHSTAPLDGGEMGHVMRKKKRHFCLRQTPFWLVLWLTVLLRFTLKIYAWIIPGYESMYCIQCKAGWLCRSQ